MLTTLALTMARIGIARYPEGGGAGGLQRSFLALDRLWERIDARLFRRSRARDLPSVSPVRWLEINRRSLCTLRYQARIFLPVVVVLIAVMMAFVRWGAEDHEIFALALGLGSLVIAIIASSAFARERTDQTLDVLLTTPITPSIIIRDKARALARVRWGITGCILVPVLINCYVMANGPESFNRILLEALLALMVPGICGWLGLLVGLLVRKQLQRAWRSLPSKTLAACWLVGYALIEDLPQLFEAGNLNMGYERMSFNTGTVVCNPVASVSGHHLLRRISRAIHAGSEMDLLRNGAGLAGCAAGLPEYGATLSEDRLARDVKRCSSGCEADQLRNTRRRQ